MTLCMAACSRVFTAIISSHQSKQPDLTPTTCPSDPSKMDLALEATQTPKPGRIYGDGQGIGAVKDSAPQVITSQSLPTSINRPNSGLMRYE